MSASTIRKESRSVHSQGWSSIHSEICLRKKSILSLPAFPENSIESLTTALCERFQFTTLELQKRAALFEKILRSPVIPCRRVVLYKSMFSTIHPPDGGPSSTFTSVPSGKKYTRSPISKDFWVIRRNIPCSSDNTVEQKEKKGVFSETGTEEKATLSVSLA